MNPWVCTMNRGPAFGGPLTGTDIEDALERKEIYVLGHQVGAYIFLDGQWLWQPNDATPAVQASR